MAVQLHLIFNHISVIGMPVVLLFMGIGFFYRNDFMKKTSLAVLMVLALAVLPAFLTGEPAEERVKSLPGISENRIETHESAAEAALILTLSAGVLAAITLLLNQTRFYRFAYFGAVVFSLLSVTMLGVTAHLGGKIRHSELNSPTAQVQQNVRETKDD